MIEGTNVMVDLETLGTKVGSVLLSIGAVKFNNEKITDTFYVNINIISCLEYGMTVDHSTMYWWKSQSQESRDALNDDLHQLKAALMKFSDWFGSSPLPLWGNGVAFDNVILSDAFDRVGLKRPWRYLDDRCFRTIKALFPLDEYPTLEGTAHNALDDAKHEAVVLIEINKKYNFK